MDRHDHFIDIQQARVHYQSFNKKDNNAAKPVLLFVHGHAAHSHWWDFIAPDFCQQFHVAAMDLSGSGDSDHRDNYSAYGFAEEILGVANQLGNQCYIVGHSFGGSMTRIAAYLHCTNQIKNNALSSDALKGFVLVDSVITANRRSGPATALPRQKQHIYPNLAQGIRRFRLRPPQPCKNKFLLEYIAKHSLKECAQGFEFKLDQAVFAKMQAHKNVELPDAVSMLSALANSDKNCPAAMIYGDSSRFFDNNSQKFLNKVFTSERVIKVNQAYHHVFLDQPLDFIAALKKVLASIIN
ncbi:MAG: alpha/beta hydrolase [Pseudomonadales bacterium]|nr:alpha/beta hydrolase [Pseudomonadales bacterium]